MITYRCVCGPNLQVGDELANCKARCPKCRAVMVVPAPAALQEPPRPPSDGSPTISSHHDITLKPSEATPTPKKKDPNA